MLQCNPTGPITVGTGALYNMPAAFPSFIVSYPMRWLATIILPFCLSITGYADDESELIDLQKKTAQENIKKCEVAKATIIETSNLLVTGDL